MPRQQVHVFSAAHNLELTEKPERMRARVRGFMARSDRVADQPPLSGPC